MKQLFFVLLFGGLLVALGCGKDVGSPVEDRLPPAKQKELDDIKAGKK